MLYIKSCIILVILILILVLVLKCYKNLKDKSNIYENLQKSNIKIGIFVISNGLNKKMIYPKYEPLNMRESYYNRFTYEKQIWIKYKDRDDGWIRRN